MSTSIKEVELKLSKEQLGALQAMREKLPADQKETRDHALYRYLNYHSFDVSKALEAFLATQKWRKETKVDEILSKPLKNIETIRKCIPYAYHGVDVDGRPIYIERTGKILCAALTKHTTYDELLASHIYGMEYLLNEMEAQSKKRGVRVNGFTAIFDLDGLGLGHRAAIPWLRSVNLFDQQHYPGLVERIVVLNSPWIMPVFYNLVKAFMDADTQSKVQILGGDVKSEMPKLIPKEHLPVEWGGECKACEGGCAHVKDASDLLSDPDEGLESHNVAAGATWAQEVKTEKEGGEVAWYFHSVGEYDIDFSVQIVYADGKKAAAKPVSRCVTSKGSFTADTEATVTFTWDNSYSWLNSKDIRYFISVVKKPDIEVSKSLTSGK